MLPGHATCRHLSRYRSYHARTCSRWYARDVDVVSLNKAAMSQVLPPEHEQAFVIEASVVPQSGKKTYGLACVWNGSPGRSETGLEISTLAWLDITDHGAYGLSVEQTPPTDTTTDAEATRLDVSLEPWARVVSAYHLSHRRDVITDGYDSQQPCTGGVRALGLEPIGKLRLDAHRRDLYQGPKRPGPGRPKPDDGKVNWDNLSRVEKVATADDTIVLYQQVLNHVQFQSNLRVVLVVDTQHNRRAVLLSTDVGLDALAMLGYDKARVHIEFLCRDATPCTGLTDGQARSQAQLNFHFNASWSAVTLAKLDARQQRGEPVAAFSMASLKRRAVNQHLIDRICQH